MATTTSPEYLRFPNDGYYPPDTNGQAMAYVADETGLGTSGDDVDYIPVAVNCAIVGGYMILGQFDTHMTPTVTQSLTMLQVGGTKREVILDSDIGQTGDLKDEIGDTAGDVLTEIGTTLTARCDVSLEDTAATATAATASRKVLIVIDVHARA